MAIGVSSEQPKFSLKLSSTFGIGKQTFYQYSGLLKRPLDDDSLKGEAPTKAPRLANKRSSGYIEEYPLQYIKQEASHEQKFANIYADYKISSGYNEQLQLHINQASNEQKFAKIDVHYKVRHNLIHSNNLLEGNAKDAMFYSVGMFGVKKRISYILPVKLEELSTMGALADLGATINVLPLSIAKKLPFELKPSKMVISLGDGSKCISIGELVHVPLTIGMKTVHVDFVILDMKEDDVAPIVLGTHSLKTLGANVFCDTGIITLNVNGVKMTFKRPGPRDGPIMQLVGGYVGAPKSSDSTVRLLAQGIRQFFRGKPKQD